MNVPFCFADVTIEADQHQPATVASVALLDHSYDLFEHDVGCTQLGLDSVDRVPLVDVEHIVGGLEKESFGSVLQATGMLSRMTQALVVGVNSTLGLIGRTVGACVAFNVLASDQYIAIVVPGKMMGEAYAERGLAPENLSRTLEDAGTVTSVLIPWNTCGVAQSGILGVATLAYAPYCIFNWVSPLMTMLVAGLGWNVRRLDGPAQEMQGGEPG